MQTPLLPKIRRFQISIFLDDPENEDSNILSILITKSLRGFEYLNHKELKRLEFCMILNAKMFREFYHLENLEYGMIFK